jgi:hypothetical protein
LTNLMRNQTRGSRSRTGRKRPKRNDYKDIPEVEKYTLVSAFQVLPLVNDPMEENYNAEMESVHFETETEELEVGTDIGQIETIDYHYETGSDALTDTVSFVIPCKPV